MDVVIFVEIKINTVRVKHFDFDQNEDNIRTNLDLLEKVRDKASVRSVVKQRQVIQYYNKRIKQRQFEKGDLVLWNYQASKPPAKQKKISPNWEGLYLVSTVVGRGAYKLQTIEGREILRTWNAQHLTKYYY